MSNPKNDAQSSETQYLNEYLTENHSSERVKGSSKRIASIDFVKGLAMIFIILAHAAFAWFDSDWRYLYGLVFAFLDILGPTLFVFLSALSVVFSIKRKRDSTSDKSIRNRVFMRGFVIIIIGILFNPFSLQTSGVAYPFPFNLCTEESLFKATIRISPFSFDSFKYLMCPMWIRSKQPFASTIRNPFAFSFCTIFVSSGREYNFFNFQKRLPP